MARVESLVVLNGEVRVGDRVKHYGQRYAALEGTATVTGLDTEPKALGGRVFVDVDRPESPYGEQGYFDADRTERCDGWPDP